MAYDLVIFDCTRRTLDQALANLLEEESIRAEEDGFILSIGDQSALVAVLTRLNDLGVRIERVRKVP